MLQKVGLVTAPLTLSFVLLTASMGAAQHHSNTALDQHSPYAEQLDSPIRGLSSQEVEDLMEGRGAGYARMAELNNYPGPRHILDLMPVLKLSPEQETAIQRIFAQMQSEARETGQDILERERQLSLAFTNQTITPASLQEQTQQLAELYGKLRTIHLNAHLQVTPLLASEQIAQYNKLRGYSEL